MNREELLHLGRERLERLRRDATAAHDSHDAYLAAGLALMWDTLCETWDLRLDENRTSRDPNWVDVPLLHSFALQHRQESAAISIKWCADYLDTLGHHDAARALREAK